MPIAQRQTRSQLTSFLAACWFVCALLLQPLAAANLTVNCNASGECCCTTESAPESSCCEAPQPERHEGAAFQMNDCDCSMQNDVPAEPWACTPPSDDASRTTERFGAFESAALPTSLAGCNATRPEIAPPKWRAEPPGPSLMIRRLQAGGLGAHLVRLGELRL